MVSPYMPPAQYPTEPPSKTQPCGYSWNRALTVTGALKGLNFGSQFREVLPPLLDKLPDKLGYNTTEEREVLEDLSSRWQDMADMFYGSTILDAQERASLIELLNRVNGFYFQISDIYEKWEKFPCMLGFQDTQVCHWPLSWGDTPEAWRARCGDPHKPGQVFEGYDPVTRSDKVFTCPPGAGAAGQPLTPDKRPKDRQKIRQLIVGILHHTRCAQHLHTRIVLHDRAVKAYREERMFAEGFGTVEPPEPPEPGVGFGEGFFAEEGGPAPVDDYPGPGPVEPLPPEGAEFEPGLDPIVLIPFDEPLPDPEDLPPADAEPAPEGAVPTERQEVATKAAMVAGVALGSYLLYKVLK